jgi:4-oxalocrotonate tautomerase
VKAVTECFIETCGGKPDQVHVIVDELSQENWGVGGELFADK